MDSSVFTIVEEAVKDLKEIKKSIPSNAKLIEIIATLETTLFLYQDAKLDEQEERPKKWFQG